MLEAVVFMCLVLPYFLLNYIFKTLREDCHKAGWFFLEEILTIIGFPFSIFDDFFE